MRKSLIVVLMIFISVLSTKMAQASSYLTYQEIVFVHDGARLLEDYSKESYETYYSKMSGRRFWGWKTYTAQKGEPVEFIKETLFVIVNEGDTAIDQSFTFGQKETIKKQYAVSGTLGLKGKGSKKEFSLGLEEKLNFDASATKTTVVDESVEIDVKIDPGTKLIVKVCGEGRVYNGVAKYYRFFKESKKGGWEIFVVTTEFFSLVKERI